MKFELTQDERALLHDALGTALDHGMLDDCKLAAHKLRDRLFDGEDESLDILKLAKRQLAEIQSEFGDALAQIEELTQEVNRLKDLVRRYRG